ncbi:MAG: DUF4157 domain-containing protein [bacterium]|nr:DUF4157 domain-containing protein [bacterium]
MSNIQAKLTVGSPNDVYEKEADAVAEKVVNMTDAQVQSKEVETPEIQAKGSSGGMEVPVGFESGLNSIKGAGVPLNRQTRENMESRMGAYFGDVRIHTGNRADKLARSINAEAFTTGHDIVFAARNGRNFESREGKKLLGHELTHVLQQRKGVQRKGVQRKSIEVARKIGPGVSLPVRKALSQGVPEADILAFMDEMNAPYTGVIPDSGSNIQRKENEHHTGNGEIIQRKTSPRKSESPTFGVTFPNGRRIPAWQVGIFVASLTANPLTYQLAFLLSSAIIATNKYNMTIGFGPAASGGAGGGLTFNGGIVVAPGGIISLYGASSVNMGFFASLSIGMEATVVEGGIKNFSGTCNGITVNIGVKFVSGGITVLYTPFPECKYLGLSCQVGIGVGLSPIEVSKTIQKTWVSGEDAIANLEKKYKVKGK